MRFDRKKFFDGYRDHFGRLSPQQVSGLNFILDAAELDPYVNDVRWLAYMLATTKHETADTFQPIHEYGSHAYFVKRYGSQTAVGKRLGNDTAEEGATYAGRGDVQLTGETNYEKAEEAIREQYPEIVAAFEVRTGKKFDLTVGDQPGDERDPDIAMDPAIAYAIMSYGMRTGMFTGRKLSDFFNDKKTDYKNARRIINGLDSAEKIAGYAKEFEEILVSAVTVEDPAKVASSDSANLVKLGEQNSDPTVKSDQSSTAQPTPVPPAPPAPPLIAPPAVAVQQAKPAEEVKEERWIDKIKAIYIAAPAMVTAALTGVGAWLQGARTEITLGFFGAAALIGMTWISWAFFIKNQREKRDTELKKLREQQAFELTKLQMQSAMHPELQTVQIVPNPVENSDQSP